MRNISLQKIFFGLLFVLMTFITVNASSHREAPLISNDPLADNVDLYAFRSPDNPNTITVIATYVPMQLPHGGPNYYSFGQNIRYEIHVDNDASIPGDEITYRFTFNVVNEDPTTFFYIRLGKQNQKLTYNLERSMDGGQSFQMIVQNGIVPPNNIGDRSIMGGAGLGANSYADLWNTGITSASTGETVFAGPTDDPFFVDLGGIFDLGDAPRQNGKAVDGLACYNVSAIAIQIPIATLLKAGTASTPSNILDPNYVVGFWASASRPAMTTLSSTGNPTYAGDWVQVSRLGMPLTNEAVIPIGYKDFWNSITPYDEIGETDMDEFFYNPELALYMDDDQFGAAVPGFSALRIQKAALGAFDFTNGADGVSALKGGDLTGTAFEVYGDLLLIPGKPRSVDLWPIFHTGVPNAIPYQLATGKAGNPLAAGKPFINNFLPNGGDMLRLNMAVPVTPRDDANFSSLGLVQAAAIGLTVAPFNTTADLEFIPNMDGFPNGRRLEDDVTRIELQAVGGVVLAAVGLWYDDYDPATSPSPVTQDLLNVLTYTTGVEKNDRAFSSTFPYLAMPFSGTGDCSGEIIKVEPTEEEVKSRFFTSSNTTSDIRVFDMLDDNSIVNSYAWKGAAADADGIYYDNDSDVMYQLNRTDNVINAYSNVIANLKEGIDPELTATSTSNFTNGREIAVLGDMLVVAQDAAASNDMINKFVTYKISPTAITLVKENVVPIALWGIHLTSNNLYAVEDVSNRLAVFANFLNEGGGDLAASRSITIDSLVRTHGITYIQDQDMMLLTDVGAASSPDDGAYFVIENFTAKSGDGVISMDERRRVGGDLTALGNPVDIAYDGFSNAIIVAERANSGGRVLAFNLADEGNVAPYYNIVFGGTSAIYLDNKMDAVTSPYVDIFNPNFTNDFIVTAKMTGGNEVPAVTTTADGVATITFNDDYTKATVNATVTNLSSAFMGVHIHDGAPGTNGGVIFNLTDDYQKGRVTSTIDITKADVAKFINGTYYINVHTANNPGGELRGNLSLESARSFGAALSGMNEVPAVTTNGKGLASVHYTSNTNVLELNIFATDLSGPITGIHLHRGATGMNGDVVENLTTYLNGGRVEVKLTPSTNYIADLIAGNIYVNIHTSENPGGEVRGQLTVRSGLTFDTWLSGSQEAPANDAQSLGLAMGTVSSDLSTITVNSVIGNLSGTLTGAHLHNGALGTAGGVSINLTDGIVGNTVRTVAPVVITAGQLSQYLSGNLYMNVHTAQYPAGEVRGQLYRIARDGYSYDLCQEQEVGAVTGTVDESGSGMIAFNRDFDEMHMMVVANSLSSDFGGAHIHNGAAGTDGPVVFDLSDRWSNNSTFFYVTDEFTPALASIIQNENAYVNVHTTNNPGGELRGQIVKDPTCPLVSAIIETNLGAIDIRLYPNPTTNNISLQFLGNSDIYQDARVQITNMRGQTVLATTVDSDMSTINTSNFTNGVYFMTIMGNNINHSIKFVKID